MALHNFTPPHLVLRPCRRCHQKTKALVNGQMQMSPVCPKCKAHYDRQFRVATIIRLNRQEA